MRPDDTAPRGLSHNSRIGGLPAFGFELLADLQHHLFVLRVGHLLIDPKIVA